MGCDTVKLKLRKIHYCVRRGDHESNCIEWKREGKERGNVEITGFVFEGTLGGRGYRKGCPAQGYEYLIMSGVPDVYA
jgi:hypothetical protein